MLAQILKDFVAATEADLNSVYVKYIKDLKENLSSIVKFVKEVDSANDLSLAMLLQKACKDPKILAEDIIPKVQKFKSELKYSVKDDTKILIDLTKFQSKQKSGSDVAVGQGPVKLNINNMDRASEASETASAATVGEKDNGLKLVYDENWLVGKVLMKYLAYEKVV